MMTTQTVTPRGSIYHNVHPNHHTKGSIHDNDHTKLAPRGTSGDQLGNCKLATRCHCCLHYNIIMSSNQIVYHNKYNLYNGKVYNAYVYNNRIGITQLKVFSCANKKSMSV